MINQNSQELNWEKFDPETSAQSQDNGHIPSAPVEAQILCWAYTETQMGRALRPAPSLCSSTHYNRAARLSGLLSASCCLMGPVKQPEKIPVPSFFKVLYCESCIVKVFVWYNSINFPWYKHTINENLQKPTIVGLPALIWKQTVRETKTKSNHKCVKKLRKTPRNGKTDGSLTHSIRFNEFCYGFPGSQRENVRLKHFAFRKLLRLFDSCWGFYRWSPAGCLQEMRSTLIIAN